MRPIIEDDLDRRHEIVACVEILEHIPSEMCEAFGDAGAKSFIKDGRPILTIPQVNKLVADKHYQHFDSTQLSELFDSYFKRVNAVSFDRRSKLFIAVEIVVGGRGAHIIVNSPPVPNPLPKLYNCRYICPTETDCRRIAPVCKK